MAISSWIVTSFFFFFTEKMKKMSAFQHVPWLLSNTSNPIVTSALHAFLNDWVTKTFPTQNLRGKVKTAAGCIFKRYFHELRDFHSLPGITQSFVEEKTMFPQSAVTCKNDVTVGIAMCPRAVEVSCVLFLNAHNINVLLALPLSLRHLNIDV